MSVSTPPPLLDGQKDSMLSSESDSQELEFRITKEDLQERSIPNIIEQFDTNYVQETSKIDLGDVASIDPTDHIAMRKWLKDEFMGIPKAPQIKPTRTPVPILVKDVPITYDGDNHFSIRVYDPANEGKSALRLRPALIMYHGGGWIHGFPAVDEDLSKFFASELRSVVIGVDYRLAPEYPFPLPHNDCFEVLNWISNNAAEYMIDIKRLALWGCSAGGNLAAGVALRDSAENEIARLRHVSLIVPVTCHPNLYPPILQSSNSSVKHFPFGGTAEESMEGLRRIWEKFAGNKFSDPYASVLLAEPRSNHPPVHVTVAGCDGLRDEGIAYALRLRNAGIDTQLEIIPGVPHGVNLSPTSIVAEQFFRNQVRVLNCALYTDF